jgi:hypothetical protein
MPWGLALHNIKAPAVPVVRYVCVVAQESPHVLVREVATFLFFPFPSGMPIAGFPWEIFGESPGIVLLDTGFSLLYVCPIKNLL